VYFDVVSEAVKTIAIPPMLFMNMPQDTDSVIWGVSWPFEHGRCR
jgi:hypothetical protein